MGASRDLTISVFAEATLVLALAVAALVAGTTDLPRDGRRQRPATQVWSSPALALAAARVRARRRRRDRPPAGRQPRHPSRADDDPRGAAARVRGPRPGATCSGRPPRGTGSCSCSPPRSSCPHPRGVWWQLGAAAGRARRCSAAALALAETLVAKMRILLVPRLLAVGGDLGAARRRLLAGRGDVSGALALARSSALGLGVVVVRRRSLAVALVTVQALLLVGGRAAQDSSRRRTRRGVRARRSRALALAALFCLLVARTREPRPVRAGDRAARAGRRSRSRSRSR